MLYHRKTPYICLKFQLRRQSAEMRPAHVAIVEAAYTEVVIQFDDTRAARIHRKEEAKSKQATTALRFQKGEGVWVTEGSNPFAH
jgi:hypothetical protein